MIERKLATKEDSIAFAYEIAPLLKKGDILALYGKLGAGKTFFTQYLCKKLGVNEYVNSPSYVLMNEYLSGDFPIFHLDLYRIKSEEEVLELGLYEIFDSGITIIEWPEIGEDFLPEKTISLKFFYDGDGRRVEVYGLDSFKVKMGI